MVAELKVLQDVQGCVHHQSEEKKQGQMEALVGIEW